MILVELAAKMAIGDCEFDVFRFSGKQMDELEVRILTAHDGSTYPSTTSHLPRLALAQASRL